MTSLRTEPMTKPEDLTRDRTIAAGRRVLSLEARALEGFAETLDETLAEAVGARARADVVERFSARRVGDVVVERLAAAVAAKQPRRGLGEKLEL